jgi:DNA replication protein DnaC
MLMNETMNKLKSMKLTGFVEALQQQEEQLGYRDMDFHQRLGLLVDWEFSKRQHSRLDRLINQAKFQNSSACIEDINYVAERHLDRNLSSNLLLQLYPHAQNILIFGRPCRKSYLHKLWGRLPADDLYPLDTSSFRLLDELKLAKEKGTKHSSSAEQFINYELLIIDDVAFPHP